MSEKIDITIDSSTDVEAGNEIVSTSSDNNIDIEILEPDYNVTINKREYVITGDNMYIPRTYDESPQWLKDIIGTITDFSLNQKLTEIGALSSTLYGLIDELNVAKNTYTNSIITSSEIDERINARIETLNSSLSGSDATIVDMISTKATPTEASALALNVLTASINDGAISSLVSNLQNAISTATSTLSNNIDIVHSEMTGDFEATSDAVSGLQTYIGVDNDGIANGTGLLSDVKILQKQNDGVIETNTGTWDVMIGIENPNNNTDNDQLDIAQEPYATWKSLDVISGNTKNRSAHVGDVYIKYTNATEGYKTYDKAYKFIKVVPDATSPYSTDSEGFTWAVITDTDVQNAYVAALNALDLADSKRRVFVITPTVPYDIGDLWLVQSGATIIGTVQGGRTIQSGDLLRCSETKTKNGLYEHNDWIPADNYREGMNAIQTDLNGWRTGTYATFVTNIQSQVDGKAETFYQNIVPTGRINSINVVANSTLDKYVGDLWKNTYVGTIGGYLGNNTEYVYTKTANGSKWDYKWTKMEVPDIVFDTIDTKKSIYSGNSVPVAVAPDVVEINDMWITGSAVVAGYDKESIYVWNGSIWIKPLKYTDDSATVALQTGLANGTATVKLTNAYVGSTPFLTYITNEIDSKVGVYSGESAPVAGQPIGVAANDIYLWFTTASKVLANGTTQTYNVTRTYKYSGSAWNEITTDSNITALADLADGKRTVFSGNSVPVGAVSRDVWIPSAANGSYLQGEIYQYNGTSWVLATRYSANIEAVRSSLQAQVDGKVETYYSSTVPTGMTALNNGDYWYCTADVSTYKKGKVYKYVDSTTSWIYTADVSRYAFDIADGKASIFSSTSVPSTGYKVNDMLIVVGSFSNGTTTFSDGVVLSSTATRASGFTASDWIKKINDTEDLDAFVSNIYTPAVSDLQSQVDSQISYYFYDSSLGQTSTSISGSNGWNTDLLKKEHHGDIAYDKSTSAGYYYDRITSSWILINSATNSGLIEALKAASLAKATADGKVSHMYGVYQSTSPATTGTYKYWLTTSKVLKVLEGASWVDFAISKLDTGDIVTVWDSGLKDEFKYYWNGNTWYSQVNGGLVAGSKAFTDLHTSLGALGTTVSGHTGQLSTVDSRIVNGVATVDSKWQYNSNLIINGVSHNSGFGLSNSAGTGVGSEFWIDASKLKFTNSAKTGRKAPFTIDATGITPEITFNGKVSFSNVNGANMSGSNLLYNSAPAIGFETKGWQTSYNDTGLASSGLLASFDPYRPFGAGAFFQTIPGTPAVGKVFDIRAVGAIPVIGGQFYEGSAYLNSHRCDSQIYVGWADSAGATITWTIGSVVTQTNATNMLAIWGRSKFIAQAPANAVSCYYYIRGISTGEANPHVFVSMCYFGRASEGQSVFSNWSEGISAGATNTAELVNNSGFTTLGAVASQGYVLPAGVANAINTNTTTIHGSKVTTGSIGAAQINVNDLFAQNITYTGVITGGNVAGGGIIKSYNNKMKIDLVNGSIYIA